jgi:perosamine synthetase
MSSDFIPLSVPNLCGNELKYVSECIQTGWVSSVGAYVDKFEENFANYIGTKYAVAVVNGTSALHISLLLHNVKPGDEVLVPNLTFVATVNAVKYCYANPVFLDATWENFGIDVDKLEAFIKSETVFKNGLTCNRKTGAAIKAIIPMHAFGYPVDMDSLKKVLSNTGIAIIEDATESLGSKYKGRKTGTLSPVACFSFNGNKIITTGGGGMITTDDENVAKKARHLTTTAKTDPLDFDHDEVGYNYRLVNVLAAIGVAQLEMIDSFVKAKRENLQYYAQLLSSSDNFFIHKEPAECESNYWMYSLIIRDPSKYQVKQVIHKLGEHKIQARPIWKLMNTLPMFREYQSYHCDMSVKIRECVVNIPCSTNLSRKHIDKVVEVINSI